MIENRRRRASIPMALATLLLALLTLATPLRAFAAADDDARAVFDQCVSWYEQYAADYAESGTEFPIPGDSGSDWIAIALGISGDASAVSGYLDGLEEYVTETYASDGALSTTIQTDYDRIILTVWALGGDPTSFGTDADGNPINLVEDGIFYWPNADGIDVQGLNADIWALIALDAGGFEEPDDALYTRESLIDTIVSCQSEDGSFGLSTSGNASGDISITGMALQALAPYMSERDDVGNAVQDALAYLSEVQGDNGVYADSGTENCESTAQAIIGMCAVGVDPRTSSMFVKSGGSAYDALLSFQNEDGSFSHILGSPGLGGYIMPTEQAMLALLAVDDLDYGNGIIYEPASVDEGGSGSASSEASASGGSVGGLSPTAWAIIAIVVVIVVVVIIVVAVRKGKKGKGGGMGGDGAGGAGPGDGDRSDSPGAGGSESGGAGPSDGGSTGDSESNGDSAAR